MNKDNKDPDFKGLYQRPASQAPAGSAASGMQGQPSQSMHLFIKSLEKGTPIPFPYLEQWGGIPVVLMDHGARNFGKYLGASLLAGTSTTVFTATKDYDNIRIYVCNVTSPGAGRTVSIDFVPAGVAVGDVTKLCKTSLLDMDTPKEFKLPGMSVGDSIRGLCDSANNVNVMVFGKPVQVA